MVAAWKGDTLKPRPSDKSRSRRVIHSSYPPAERSREGVRTGRDVGREDPIDALARGRRPLKAETGVRFP